MALKHDLNECGHKKTGVISSLVFLAALCGGAAMALAAPADVNFAPANDDDLSMIKRVYGNAIFRKENKFDVSKPITLGPDGARIVFVKFRGKGYCDANGCYTTGLKTSDGYNWAGVFERHINSVAMGDVTGSGVIDIIVNKKERWQWAATKYVATLSGIGRDAVPADKASPEVMAAIKDYIEETPAFADLLASSAPGSSVTVREKRINLGTAFSRSWIASIDGSVCGNAIGCPYFMVAEERGGNARVVGKAYSVGAVSVLETARAGAFDIAVASGLGYSVYGWTGNHYQEFQTTWPSKLTPLP